MCNLFAGSEVVELGIQIEKNGRDFYSTLASATKNAQAAEKFKFLAQEEEKHIQVFKNILEQTQKYQPQGLDSGDYFAYMNALASEHIFTKKDVGVEIAKKVKSDKEAIEMGIGFEQDSIVFYIGIKKIVPDYDWKIIDELIAQEEKHLLMLSGMKDSF
jgi:rubrerythrin